MHIEATRRTYTDVTKLRRLTALLAGLLWVLSGCAGIAPKPERTAGAQQEQVDPTLQRKLNTLEDQAALAIKQNHLAYPEAGSAVSLFQQMLALNPGNKEATRGLEQVVEQYIALALAAADERLFAKAKSMLARAKLVDASHPSLEPTMTQISLLKNAQRNTIQLNAKQLFTSATKDKITSLVERGNTNCRYAIAANNDEQGRWIYKTIKSAAPNGRPKAKIIISSPTRIEQICLTISE